MDHRTPDEALKDHVALQLDGLPLRARHMFGGYGLYLEDRFFGVISEGRLYFRTDHSTRVAYTSRGMTALQPKYRARGPRAVDRNFEVPDDVLQDASKLRAWALEAASSAPKP